MVCISKDMFVIPSPLGPLGNTSQPSVQEGSREIGDSKRRRTPPRPKWIPKAPKCIPSQGSHFGRNLLWCEEICLGTPPAWTAVICEIPHESSLNHSEAIGLLKCLVS